ncbi:MAG: hypothetical protein ABFS56_07685 [Pseudomonadota bacterium]
MSLIINFSRNGLLLVFLYVLLSSVSYANFNIKHCYDCGNVLVGAAFFQPNVIKWGTNGSSAAILLEAGGNFGFSGDSAYLSETDPNKWLHKSTYDLAIDAGYFSPPPMGHYFAPDKEGNLESPNRYIALLDSPNDVVRGVTVRGTGIADDEDNPAITLEVKAVQETLDQTGCFDGTAQCQEVLDENDGRKLIRIEEAHPVACADGTTAQCQEVEMLDNRHLVFTITPRLDSAKVPAGVKPVKHVFIDLIFDDENTQCKSMRQQSFETKNLTPNNFNDINQYYHYMGTGGPWFTNAACGFSVPFLVSVNKPFQIQTRNQRLTEDGYAKITFAVRGHYDREHPEYWPGSQPTFRLKTQGKLIVNVKGEGKISSEQVGIDGCILECTAQFPSGEVQLIPDPNNRDVIWGENCPEGKANVVTGQYDTSCTVEFGSLGGGWKFKPDPTYQEEDVIESNAKFYGALIENHQRLANGGEFAVGTEVDIVATVEPAEQHVNRWAHLLLLVNDTLWTKNGQNSDFSWTFWGIFDKNFDFSKNIPADAGTRKLYKSFNIDIFNGTFSPDLAGTYDVLVGYRIINTGEIVYNPEPIHFTVLESSTTD